MLLGNSWPGDYNSLCGSPVSITIKVMAQTAAMASDAPRPPLKRRMRCCPPLPGRN